MTVYQCHSIIRIFNFLIVCVKYECFFPGINRSCHSIISICTLLIVPSTNMLSIMSYSARSMSIFTIMSFVAAVLFFNQEEKSIDSIFTFVSFFR